MRFQILHEAPNMMRLRAVQPRMTAEQADLLEAWIRQTPGVETVKVYERTCGVIVHYTGSRQAVTGRLAGFSYEKAGAQIQILSHSGRELNAVYKEKVVFLTIRHFLRKLFLPAPVRYAVNIIKAVPYVRRALSNLLHLRFDMELLDGTAIAASLITGDGDTAGSVMFLLKIGDYLEEWTHKKSIDDLARSMALNVDQVWLRTEGGEDVLVPLASVSVGDRVCVNTGSMIPLDGEVEEGEAMVNQAALTGEGIPVAKRAGSTVFGGTVVDEGSLLIRVKQTLGSGKYDQIVKMIEDSEKLNSETARRATSLADKLVPWCLGGSLLTWLLTRNVTRAVSVLMVDFSCALKLALPLSVLSAMREASRYHITVKGGKYLERVSQAKTVIFDKTGTLTNACPTVADVIPFHGQDRDEMLRVAACLEEHFPHSIANAVVKAAKDEGLFHAEMHSTVEYIVAHGIASRIEGERVIIGSSHFVFEDEHAVVAPEDQARFDALPARYSLLYLAIGGVLSAAVCIADPLRPEAVCVVEKLHTCGFEKIVMLTGDSRRTAAAIAAEVGVDDHLAEVLPEDKAAYIRREQEAGRTVIMVGDGINDAPALSLADVGIAMGNGAAIAREVADITIAADDLNELVALKNLSDALMRRINGSYRFVMGFNGGLMVLGALGVLAPSVSALLHNGSTVALSLRNMSDLTKDAQQELLPQT